MSPAKKDLSTNEQIQRALDRLLQADPWLAPYKEIIQRRLLKIEETEQKLTGGKMSLADFASAHEYFGLHFVNGQWVFREWAPHATAIFLIGDITGWQEKDAFALNVLEDAAPQMPGASSRIRSR